jgi:hypothetical protein
MDKLLAIAEIFGVGVGVAKIIGNEHGGLPGELKPLAAFVAGYKIVEANHVRGSFREFFSILLASTTRQLFFLAADFPADRGFEILSAARAYQLGLADLFLFGVEGALVHIKQRGHSPHYRL